MIDPNSPEVKTAEAKAQRNQQLIYEWRKRLDAAKVDPNTTNEELRELHKMGLDICSSGLDIAVPFLFDEEFPEETREQVLKMMADIPLLREINGIV